MFNTKLWLVSCQSQYQHGRVYSVGMYPCCDGYHSQPYHRSQQNQTSQLLTDGNPHLDHNSARGRRLFFRRAVEGSNATRQ
jgi:hypothetical protein